MASMVNLFPDVNNLVERLESQLQLIRSFGLSDGIKDQTELQKACTCLALRARDALSPGTSLRGIRPTYAALGRLIQASIATRRSSASTTETATDHESCSVRLRVLSTAAACMLKVALLNN